MVRRSMGMGAHGGLRRLGGYTAGSIVALLLVAAAAPAKHEEPRPKPKAAPQQWLWTTAWAEAVLRKHFPAVTALCVPHGRPTRSHGVTRYGEFVCGIVLRDGSQYAIDLRPRSKSSWTTVTLRRGETTPPVATTTATTTASAAPGQGSHGRGARGTPAPPAAAHGQGSG